MLATLLLRVLALLLLRLLALLRAIVTNAAIHPGIRDISLSHSFLLLGKVRRGSAVVC